MVDSANAFPEDDSEFAETGLTPIPSVKVKPPRVKEVPIHFECKLHQVIELGPNRHPLVIGEVVYMHVDPACMTNGYIDMKKLASDRSAQRLLLRHARRNLRARIRRRPAALNMNTFDAVVTAFAILAVVMGFMSGLLRSLATILAYLIAAPIAIALDAAPRRPSRPAAIPPDKTWVVLSWCSSRLASSSARCCATASPNSSATMPALFDRVAGAAARRGAHLSGRGADRRRLRSHHSRRPPAAFPYWLEAAAISLRRRAKGPANPCRPMSRITSTALKRERVRS